MDNIFIVYLLQKLQFTGMSNNVRLGEHVRVELTMVTTAQRLFQRSLKRDGWVQSHPVGIRDHTVHAERAPPRAGKDQNTLIPH